MNPSEVTRFWSKVDKSGECWMWLGSKVGMNYGQFYLQGRTRRAHRVAWEIAIGPIPDGLCILHICDNPSCVNPRHMRLGTYADNNKDAAQKGRSAKGERHGSRTHPDRLPRGDRNGSRLHPERMPRGERHGSRTHPESILRGEKHTQAKLTEEEVKAIRKSRNEGMTTSKLAQEYAVNISTIKRIVNGRLWSHVG